MVLNEVLEVHPVTGTLTQWLSHGQTLKITGVKMVSARICRYLRAIGLPASEGIPSQLSLLKFYLTVQKFHEPLTVSSNILLLKAILLRCYSSDGLSRSLIFSVQSPDSIEECASYDIKYCLLNLYRLVLAQYQYHFCHRGICRMAKQPVN